MFGQHSPLGFGSSRILIGVEEVGIDAGCFKLPEIAALIKFVQFDGGRLHNVQPFPGQDSTRE